MSRASPWATPRERELYLPRPRLMGYTAVSVWLRELGLAGGRTETVELVDRSVWSTGTVEERVPDAGP